MRRAYTDFAAGVRKQATVPEGAISLGLAGTAPGLVVEAGRRRSIVLPGPPSELQRLWPNALATVLVRRVLDGGEPPLRRTLRLFGAGESTVAQAFAEAGGDGDGVEATICARDFEVVVELLAEPGAEERAERLTSSSASGSGATSTPTTGGRSRRSCSQLCRDRGLTLATAESCTGGLIVARLTAVPGFSATRWAGSSPTPTSSRSASSGCRRS